MTFYPDRFSSFQHIEEGKQNLASQEITNLGEGFRVLKPIPVELYEELGWSEGGNIVASVRDSLGLLVTGRGRTPEEAVSDLVKLIRIQWSFLEQMPRVTGIAKTACNKLGQFVEKTGPAKQKAYSLEDWRSKISKPSRSAGGGHRINRHISEKPILPPRDTDWM